MGDQSRFDRVDKQLGVRESRSATLRVGRGDKIKMLKSE